MKMLLVEVAVACAVDYAYSYVKRHTGIQAKLDNLFMKRLVAAENNLTK